MRVDDDLIRQIGKSEIFSEYQAAFEDATGLPLAIHPTEFWNLPHRNRRNENPFCAMMAQTNRTCAACLEVQQRAVEAANDRPVTVTCFAGLSDTAVPLKLGQRRIGFLQTGQVALKEPTRAGFKSISAQILEWAPKIDLARLEEAYLNSKVLTQQQHAAVIRLLENFGQQLSAAANRMTLQDAEAEPPMICLTPTCASVKLPIPSVSNP
jgi:ligand-binding sensor protein